MFRIIHTDPWLRGDKYRTSRTVSLMNNRSSGACGGAKPQTGSWVAAELAGPGIGDVSRQPNVACTLQNAARRSNAHGTAYLRTCHSGAVIHARADTPEDSSASSPSGPSDVLLGRLSGGELPGCTLSFCLPQLQPQLPYMMGCSCSLLRQW